MKKIFITSLLILTLLPAAGFAQDDRNCGVQDTDETVALVNPLGFLGICTPGELVAKVIAGFAAIFGIIAVAFLVFSGFKLVIASNEESIKSARESITWSVGGFVVALLSFTVISGVSKLLGFSGTSPNFDVINQGGFLSGPSDPGDFISVLSFIMTSILGLIGIVTILMIIYYGYRYITAAGNEESIEQAKTGLKWAIVGFIITVMAFTIISIVQGLLFFGSGV